MMGCHKCIEIWEHFSFEWCSELGISKTCWVSGQYTKLQLHVTLNIYFDHSRKTSWRHVSLMVCILPSVTVLCKQPHDVHVSTQRHVVRIVRRWRQTIFDAFIWIDTNCLTAHEKLHLPDWLPFLNFLLFEVCSIALVYPLISDCTFDM